MHLSISTSPLFLRGGARRPYKACRVPTAPPPSGRGRLRRRPNEDQVLCFGVDELGVRAHAEQADGRQRDGAGEHGHEVEGDGVREAGGQLEVQQLVTAEEKGLVLREGEAQRLGW